MTRTSKTVLNKSDESEHPCLVPDLRGNAFNFSPLNMMLAMGLSLMAFIMLRYAHFMESFYYKWMVKYIKSFFLHLLRGSYSFYFSISYCDVSHWYADSEKSLHPWGKWWSWCTIPFFLLFIYLFLAALDLRCFAWAFSSCSKWVLLFIAMLGLLIVIASFVAEHRL